MQWPTATATTPTRASSAASPSVLITAALKTTVLWTASPSAPTRRIPPWWSARTASPSARRTDENRPGRGPGRFLGYIIVFRGVGGCCSRYVLLAYAASYICTDLFRPTQRTYSFPRRKRVSRKVRLGAGAPKNPNGGRRRIDISAHDTSRRRYRCSDSRQPCSTFERFDSCIRLRRYASA